MIKVELSDQQVDQLVESFMEDGHTEEETIVYTKWLTKIQVDIAIIDLMLNGLVKAVGIDKETESPLLSLTGMGQVAGATILGGEAQA